MSGLLRHELRKLAPLFIVLIFMQWGDILFEPFYERLDEHAWIGSSDGGMGDALLLLTLSLVLAHALFVREHDEGTIDFLYSLPLSRRQIFFTKVLAALVALFVAEIAGQLSAWVVQLPNHQSFSGHQFRIGLAISRSLLSFSLSVIALCYGVLGSFFRRFALLLYALAGVLVTVCERVFPGANRFDPTRIVNFEYEGSRLVVPWQALTLHLGAAAVALVLGYLLWTDAVERARPLLRRLTSGWIGVVGTLVAVGLLVWLFLPSRTAKLDAPAEYEDFSTLKAETAHFSIVYPYNLRERALAVIRIADQAYVDVQGALDARAGAPIALDLTFTGDEYAGLAAWHKIRLDLARGVADDADGTQLTRALYHEVTHAFEFQESDRRIQDHDGETHFFTEGLAEVISRQLVPASRGGLAAHRLAAAAMARQRVRFEELIDESAFSVRHYEPLVYPLGETWAEALIRACGPKAPGQLLRAMGRKDAPQEESALAFWQDSVRAAGCDLERVNATWHASIGELQRRERAFLDTLPRLSGGVARREGRDLVLRALPDRASPPGMRYLARVRNSASTPESETREVEAHGTRGAVAKGAAVELRVPAAWISGNAFEVQLGLAFDPDGMPYFEDWRPAHVPPASAK